MLCRHSGYGYRTWHAHANTVYMQMVDALQHAGSDKRIQGVVGCIGDAQRHGGLAQVQELRNAVLGFRSALLVFKVDMHPASSALVCILSRTPSGHTGMNLEVTPVISQLHFVAIVGTPDSFGIQASQQPDLCLKVQSHTVSLLHCSVILQEIEARCCPHNCILRLVWGGWR